MRVAKSLSRSTRILCLIHLAGNGSDVDLRALVERVGLVAATDRLLIDKPAAGAALLRVVPRDRLGHCVLCVLDGATRAMEFVVVVVPAKVLLPASDVLRDDQIGSDGDSWAGCWLGQARPKGDGWAGP